MARWDPGADERLRKAALELYYERGYDNVTVTQIAERAGLTRRSYFRYYADKREVLFAGSEHLPAAFAEAVLAAADTVSPVSAVLDAVASVGTRLIEHIDHAAERQSVIAASTELQERERTKLAAITTAIGDALQRRQVEPSTARLLAHIGTVAFQNAFERWIRAGGTTSFTSDLDAVVGTLRESLAPAPPPRAR